MRWIYIITVILLFSSALWAQSDLLTQTEHKLIRRVVIFPVQVNPTLAKIAEESWWSLREELTKGKRFLVASRNFLKNKDVFQARGKLTPADAIVLGQLLDANALVTTWLKDRELTMSVYGGEYGRLLWSYKIHLNSSRPIKSQLVGAIQQLVRAFIAAIPYQGFVVVDSLWGRPVHYLNGKVVVKVDVGLDAKVEVGDKVQLVRIRSDRLRMLFDGNLQIEVFAEGEVLEREHREIKVEVLRVTNLSQISEESLVRLPREMKRIQDLYALSLGELKNVNLEYFPSDMATLEEEEMERKEKKPLIASITFLVNMAVFLLLAF